MVRECLFLGCSEDFGVAADDRRPEDERTVRPAEALIEAEPRCDDFGAAPHIASEEPVRLVAAERAELRGGDPPTVAGVDLDGLDIVQAGVLHHRNSVSADDVIAFARGPCRRSSEARFS